MAERSGFFNALYTNGAYDRKYNANDYSDNLAVIISNGVLRSENDDLRVQASGMVVSVAAGRAWINGHYYYNDSTFTFAAVPAPTGGSRWDRVVLRLDNDVSGRSIRLHYVQGTAADSPTKPALTRSGNVYEIALADIRVTANATSLSVTDQRSNNSVCGWVYSTVGDNSFFETMDNSFNEWFAEKKDTLASVTLFKQYVWRYALPVAAQKLTFNISQWNPDVCFLEVYVNGIFVVEGVDYTLANSTLDFSNQLVKGTEIVIKVYKSIDGTGIESVADEITELQNTLAELDVVTDYDYICNGVDDNVKLSEIAQAWLNGGDDYACKKIRVFGTFGAQAAYGGSGTSASPYRWLSLGGNAELNRRIIFDFSCCTQISPTIAAGTYNYIFYGENVHIIGANVRVEQKGAGTIVRVFNSPAGAVYADSCRFWVTAYESSIIANTGTFVNCRASVANSQGNSYCFLPFTNGLLRVVGGEYYAYTGSSTGYRSAIVGQSAGTAVSILNAVNAPTTARSGYYQTHSLIQLTGGGYMNSSDLVSELPVSVVAGISDIRGTIPLSKAGNM